MSTVKNVTTSTFQAEVLERTGKPVVVDFWAVWCMPCKKLSPLLEEVAGEFGDRVEIVKINVDEERELAAQYRIMSIPTVMIFKDGQKVDEFIGLRPKPAIVAQISKHL